MDKRALFAKKLIIVMSELKLSEVIGVSVGTKNMMNSMVDKETLDLINECTINNNIDTVDYSKVYWNIYQQKMGFTQLNMDSGLLSISHLGGDGKLNIYFEEPIPEITDYKAALTGIKYLSETNNEIGVSAGKELEKIRMIK